MAETRYSCPRCRDGEVALLLLPCELRRSCLRQRRRRNQDRRRSQLHQPGWSLLPRHQRAEACEPSRPSQPRAQARGREGRRQVDSDGLRRGDPGSRRPSEPDQGGKRRRGRCLRWRHHPHRRLGTPPLAEPVRHAQRVPQRASLLDPHVHGRDLRLGLVSLRDRPGRRQVPHPVGHEPGRVHASRHARLHRPAARRHEGHRRRPALLRDGIQGRPVASAASGL